MQATTYPQSLDLSTRFADVTLLRRDCAALRLLRLLQSWAETHIIEPGRGTCWIARDWLESKLSVSRSTLYRAFARLRSTGWVRDELVTDDGGQEKPGVVVALRSESGFVPQPRDASEMQVRQACDSDATDLGRPTSMEKLSKGKRRSEGRSRVQESLFPLPPTEPDPVNRDSAARPQLRAAAKELDEYERKRYAEHPRCVRKKRDTPESRRISVDAIVAALEWHIQREPDLELEERVVRFRAVVELNWTGAERRIQTWGWWTGTAMWKPQSLDRVLGWLEEPRNAIYLERARGDLQAPADDGDDEWSQDSIEEQERAYRRRQGLPEDPKVAELVGDVERGPDPCNVVTLTQTRLDVPITVTPASDWSDMPEDLALDMTPAEREAAEQISDCIDRGAIDDSILGEMRALLDGLDIGESDAQSD